MNPIHFFTLGFYSQYLLIGIIIVVGLFSFNVIKNPFDNSEKTLLVSNKNVEIIQRKKVNS